MKHVSMLALSLGLAMNTPAQAADQAQTQATQQAQTQERDRVYGSELMTQQERTEYHNHMRALKTEQERDAYRLAHHKKMQERAKAQGKTLPDMPPAGMGPGSGMGPGMGQGSGGMGSGGKGIGPHGYGY